ncbi:MAG: SNF2-related protein [Actinomycetota bacterium]|nr:SNF2-related protein [Actinomycetota bacterium]
MTLDHADTSFLERQVGVPTFARGSAYAAQGSVLLRMASTAAVPGSRQTMSGAVAGNAAAPYRVSVELGYGADGRLVSFRGSCTCPVGSNCKHAVALVLASDPGEVPGSGGPVDHRPAPGSAGRPPVRPPTRRARPAWEAPVATILAGTTAVGVGDDQAALALQFEVVPPQAATSRRTGPKPASIKVRPVVRGRNGNWVRSGVSWSRLDYWSFGQRGDERTEQHLLLLQELLALSRIHRSRYYGYGEETVALEAIPSRRLWDLLNEGDDQGLPLVTSGRAATPVELHREPVDVVLDVRDDGGGLEVAPSFADGDGPIDVGGLVLIGAHRHGVGWWRGGSAPGGTGEGTLHLAPLGAPLAPGVEALLGREPVRVPPGDADRFFATAYPALRRRIPVRSADGSVVLPDPAPPELHLVLRHRPGPVIEVSWRWGMAGSGSRLPLWPEPSGRIEDDHELAVVASVCAVLDGHPRLFEAFAGDQRLSADSVLVGMDAVRFVAEIVPVLGSLPGVSVENVGEVPDYRRLEDSPVVHLDGGTPTGGDWFDLSVTVTIGGEDVPFAELFMALAGGDEHLLLPSGAYFSLDRDELRQLARLIDEARSLHETSIGAIRLSRFQAGLWEELKRLGVVSAQAGRWEAAVRALLEVGDRVDHPAPAGLTATLRPYQRDGFTWLAYLFEAGLGGILADDMGLGKTIQALALMCHVRDRGAAPAPFLVVAPTSVVGNWEAECRRFAPDLQPVAVTETAARRGVPLEEAVAGADVVITSYSLFRLDYDEYAALGWSALFLDEAQMVKNRASQGFQKAKLLPVPCKVAMTGTPIENNLMELWSLLAITAPGLFPSPERFTEYYRHPIERRGDGDRLDLLRRRVRPLMLRRTKEEVAADLPDKQEQVLELDLLPRHHRLYQTYLARERQKVLGLLGDVQKNRFEILKSLTVLRQASLAGSLVDERHVRVPSTKLDVLEELLTEIVADGHRVLVFSQFTRFLGMARQRIEAAGIDACYLDGRTRNRQEVIEQFRTGDAPVFLISLKAGGFGLNLTEADYCIILDPWWNPATEAQAVDRAHRIGQAKKVMVYRLVAKDTIEEKVMALKDRKAALVAQVMGEGAFEAGALTAADIRQLLE